MFMIKLMLLSSYYAIEFISKVTAMLLIKLTSCTDIEESICLHHLNLYIPHSSNLNQSRSTILFKKSILQGCICP